MQGNVTGKIVFRIDKKSWDNLDLFQKKMGAIKDQMNGLGKNIKIGAVTNQVARVQKKINDVKVKASKTLFADMLRQEEKYHTDALRMNRQFDRKRRLESKAKSAAFGSRINQMYSGGSGAKASNTLFADMMRQEVKDHAEAIRMNREFDRAAKQRQKELDNKTAMQQRVISNKNAVTGRLVNAPSGAREQMFKQGGIFDRLSANYMSGAISANDFSKSVNRAATALLRQEAAAKRARPSVRDLRTELVQATAAFTAFSAGVNIFQTGKELQSLEAGMLIFAGTENKVRQEMGWLVEQSQRLGTNFMVAAREYTKFSIVAKNKMDENQTKELFTAYSELATVQQMDEQRFHRGMNALMQMLSKGQLMAEEVKGQFAEAAYGGVGLFAEALGMTEREFFKAMESGSLLSSEVLPKLAVQMKKVANTNGALTKAQKSVNAEQQRFYTQLALAKKDFFEGGFGQAMADTFKTISDFLKTTNVRAFGAAFGGMVSGMVDSINLLLLPLKHAINLFGVLFGESGSKWIGYGLGAAFLAGKIYMVAKAMRTVIDLSKMFARTPLGFALTAASVVGGSWLADKYLSGDGSTQQTPYMAYKPTDTMVNQYAYQRQSQTVNVVVQPDSGEFGRAVTAKIADGRYQENAQTVQEIIG